MIAYVTEIEQQEFKSIVKRGAKTKHVKAYDQKVAVTSQPDLFSHTAEERAVWDLYMDN
jgi:transcriptional regulator of aromatic amino acid metabolism